MKNQAIELNKKSKTNIGSKIQKLLDLHKVSLSKVASATGLTAETIRQIINGSIKNPGIETLTKIADGFSISLFDLLEMKNVAPNITKKKIKLIDIFDLQKLSIQANIDDLINQSIHSIEILHLDPNVFDSEFFAIEVNPNLAEKLTNCGMPILKQGDLLIFIKSGDLSINSIVLAKYNNEMIIMGIIIEIENSNVWIKSVEIPQKQIVTKIKKQDIVGIVNNVQFV